MPLPRLAVILAWGSVVGSAMQFGVQLPFVLKMAPDLRFALDLASTEVRTVVRNFLPVFVSRGVVQASAYVDQLLASLLPTGAVAGMTNALLLATLPVSLFGMAVSAAELPAMAGVAVDAAGTDALRRRLDAGLRQIAFFVVPSAVAFLALGDVIAAAVLQTGTISDTLMPSMSGRSSPGLRLACSPRRSDVSTRPRTTRCAIRVRRSSTRSSAWC